MEIAGAAAVKLNGDVMMDLVLNFPWCVMEKRIAKIRQMKNIAMYQVILGLQLPGHVRMGLLFNYGQSVISRTTHIVLMALMKNTATL